MIYENGLTDISILSPIIHAIESLHLKPKMKSSSYVTLDGCEYTLKFGVDSFEAHYKWHTVTEDLRDLQTIADLLMELNSVL